MTDEHRIDRMAGCACLGKLMLGIVAAALAVYCVLNLNQCFYMTDRGSVFLRERHMIKDLKIAIQTYEMEYNAFPIPAADTPNTDISIRSRGTILLTLQGGDVIALNPRTIKFIDLPMARARRDGLWQDGSEWVLSGYWGEPYYFIIDTNKDNMITNPEFGADQSDPKYAAKCRYIPPPPTLPAKVIIYSSGPDRDPKTWNDNICSWRQ